MKLSQDFFNEFDMYITPSDIIEYLYCPRFIYFMKCLRIEQHEEKRYKVQKGREVHKNRVQTSGSYIRKKIGGLDKEIDVSLTSKTLGIKGVVDEVYRLEDGSMAPLDYKYAKYQDKLYKTYEIQSILYALLIEENYQKEVNIGYLVYCREGQDVHRIDITQKKKNQIYSILKEYKKVSSGYYPKATTYKSRCLDCCYKNICKK